MLYVATNSIRGCEFGTERYLADDPCLLVSWHVGSDSEDYSAVSNCHDLDGRAVCRCRSRELVTETHMAPRIFILDRLQSFGLDAGAHSILAWQSA